MSMQSQMLIGGKKKVEDTTEFRDMLQEEHKRYTQPIHSNLPSHQPTVNLRSTLI